MEILVLPALEDNFIYLLCRAGEAAVVDPADAGLVLAELEKRRLELTHILVTHDHPDHVAGVPELQRKTSAAVITGGGGFVSVGTDFTVLPTPGHTADHVSFYSQDAHALFCGDTLFGAGCGRLFGNPPAWMYQSLQSLAALPDNTRVFFGHEYTRDNLRFAATVEPGNPHIADRLKQLRIPSTPSTVKLEKATNPFVRARSVDEFAELRRRKDVFR